MSVLHLDFETCSELDLRKVGADVYSRHPSLIVTVIAWAFDDDPVQSETCLKALPAAIQSHLFLGGAFKAWNAAFETAILRNHYHFLLHPGQPVCTMQAALHSGLPGSLADAGPAIGSFLPEGHERASADDADVAGHGRSWRTGQGALGTWTIHPSSRRFRHIARAT